MEQSTHHTYEAVAHVLGTLNTKLVGSILRGESTETSDLGQLTEIAEECAKRANTILPPGTIRDKRALEDAGAEAAGLPTITNILGEYEALRKIRDDLVRSFAIRTRDILTL